jgi:hypothetical protein
MAKKNKTFAQRAKSIISKYKRADWDPIEKNALDEALGKLQQEQEAYKQSNQIGEYKCGGKMYARGGVFPPNTSGTNLGLSTQSIFNRPFQNDYLSSNLSGYSFQKPYQSIFDRSPVVNTQASSNVDTGGVKDNNPPLVSAPEMGGSEGFYDDSSLVEGAQPLDVNVKSAYNIQEPNYTADGTGAAQTEDGSSPYATSIAPQLISGATTALGNILMARNQRDPRKARLPRVSGEPISFERARQSARRAASEGSSRARYATARGARTRGEYMAGRGAAEAAIAGNLGETLSQSQMKEDIVNANMKAGMNKANAEIAAREQLFNIQQEEQARKDREAYTSAAIQSIPQMTRDISAQQAQDRLINVLGDKYGWYMQQDPNAKWHQRKKSPVVKFRG